MRSCSPRTPEKVRAQQGTLVFLDVEISPGKGQSLGAGHRPRVVPRARSCPPVRPEVELLEQLLVLRQAPHLRRPQHSPHLALVLDERLLATVVWLGRPGVAPPGRVMVRRNEAVIPSRKRRAGLAERRARFTLAATRLSHPAAFTTATVAFRSSLGLGAWQYRGSNSAYAVATLWTENCIRNCAEGTCHPHPIDVTLYRVRPHGTPAGTGIEVPGGAVGLRARSMPPTSRSCSGCC
jgi:hypothetical protein